MSLFTIITVCYNAENDIKRTIESVLSQTYCDYEYLIVDGLSQDSTVKVAESFQEAFKVKRVIYKVMSEKDTGIYNAMNKASDMAMGKWLLFLNAGDRLADNNILECVSKYDCMDAAILYGDVICSICDRYKKIPAKELSELKKGMVFCHQSAFILKEKMVEYRYDEAFRIGADYDFISRCYTSGETLEKINVTVSIFELGGISSDPVAHMLEHLQIQRIHSFITEEEYQKEVEYWTKKAKFYKIRNRIEKCIPYSIVLYFRQKKYERLGYRKI